MAQWKLWSLPQATTVGIILFHLQHAAHIPNLYFDIPRDQHDRDLAGLLGASFVFKSRKGPISVDVSH